MINFNIKTILFIILPLFCGFLIYIFLRNNYNFIQTPILYFMKYNASDGLWALSLSIFIFTIWYDASFISKLFSFLLCLILTTFVELFQLLKIFPGTFDLIDLGISALSVGLALIIYNNLFIEGELDEKQSI